ncbi:MAG: ABC transporter permease [Coriobacteriales bacterium]|nr:ABC transporter permease [Coriobacteriales bacterium]
MQETKKTQKKKDWFIVKSLVSKDFKIKYRRSILGVLWSVLNPLLMMIVLTAVFSYMFKFDIEFFPVYLILGQTLFNFMSGSTTDAMTSIIDSAPLIKKIRINKIIFPFEKVLFGLLNFAISLIAVAAVLIFFRISPTANILLLPVLLLELFMFTLGLGLILSALTVFFRDIEHLWSVIATAWMYLTPLFYPTSILQDWMMRIMEFNPMYYYVNYFREIALWGTTPAISEQLICLGCGAVALAIGYLIFKKVEKKFILYV